MSESSARTKRQEQGDRSREEILDAASRLMAARGFDGTSISTLAKESGLPASSIYWHFGSKEGVLMAVMERGAAEFVELTALDNLPRAATRSEKVTWVLQRAARIIGESPEFLRLQTILLLSAPAGGANAAVLRLRQQQRDGLRDALALCFAEPGAAPAIQTADRLVDFAGAAFEGAFLAAQGGSAEYSAILRRLADALIRMADEDQEPAGA
ncbi:MAG TPA: TetR/AcrR family transcriptional regulator [Trebonia sp.]